MFGRETLRSHYTETSTQKQETTCQIFCNWKARPIDTEPGVRELWWDGGKSSESARVGNVTHGASRGVRGTWRKGEGTPEKRLCKQRQHTSPPSGGTGLLFLPANCHTGCRGLQADVLSSFQKDPCAFTLCQTLFLTHSAQSGSSPECAPLMARPWPSKNMTAQM